MALRMLDPTMTMNSECIGDTVTITYRRGYESRRAAGTWARQYARDRRRGERAAFIDSEIGEVGDGTVVTYVYRLTRKDAHLRAQLSESVQNR
jgi:hypothetical protein